MLDSLLDPELLAVATPDELAEIVELAKRGYGRLQWEDEARPKQIVGDAYITFLCGGRRSGKTRSGAEWLARELEGDGPGDVSAIVAPTFGEGRDKCVEGVAGVLGALKRRGVVVRNWNRSLGELWLASGAKVIVDEAHTGAAKVQGEGLRRAWCDELRNWRSPRWDVMAWDESLIPAVSAGNPQIVVTSTLKPKPLVKRLLKDPRVDLRHMTTWENADNLADEFLYEMRQRYAGTRLGLQELEGRLLEDVEGALWRMEWIERHRAEVGPVEYRATVVALDPSDGTEQGDEQAICVAGLGLDNHMYVLSCDGYRDRTQVGWITRALELCREHKATLVYEKNHGGAPLRVLIEMVMGQSGLRAPMREVHASVGKRTRAEPIAALYEGGAVRTQGQVRHLGTFPELESEMTSWTGAPGEKSPDRMDALVWALTHLLGYGAPPGFGEAPGEQSNGVAKYSDASPGVVRWE